MRRLKQALATDAFSPIRYDGEKPATLLAEDKGDRRAEAEHPGRQRAHHADRRRVRALAMNWVIWSSDHLVIRPTEMNDQMTR